MGNRLKTTVLLASLTAFLVFLGGLFGGETGMIFCFILSLVLNFFSYWYSDKIVLKLYKATPLTQSSKIYEIVQRLCSKRSLPTPKIYSIPSSALNAFATGRNPNNAAIAVTEGLEKALDDEELEGVLAHELSHIQNRDTLVSTIAASLAGAIMMIANMAKWAAIFGVGGGDRDDRPHPAVLLLTAFIAPLAALLIQMAISRSREYLADKTGAETTHNPHGLARALKKLSTQSALPAPAHTAHLFIMNPLTKSGVASLFSTHPPLEERIRRLESIRP
ncbi:MAG: zinc metalloprotease HtpX [Deltaproteobacteria bacterium]|nr:zinc metalloprotease HtpX [Deltaproteobacteria bacterium]